MLKYDHILSSNRMLISLFFTKLIKINDEMQKKKPLM